MVNTNDAKKISRKVCHIEIKDMNFQDQGYFVLERIVIIQAELPDPLKLSALQKLENGYAQEIVNFHKRVISDMIVKAIGGQITKSQLRKSGFIKISMNVRTLGVSSGVIDLICFIYYSNEPIQIQIKMFQT